MERLLNLWINEQVDQGKSNMNGMAIFTKVLELHELIAQEQCHARNMEFYWLFEDRHHLNQNSIISG